MSIKSKEERLYDRYINRIATEVELFFRRKFSTKVSVSPIFKYERIRDEETSLIIERKVPVMDEITGKPKKQIKVVLTGDTILNSYFISSKMIEFQKKYPNITFFVDF